MRTSHALALAALAAALAAALLWWLVGEPAQSPDSVAMAPPSVESPSNPDGASAVSGADAERTPAVPAPGSLSGLGAGPPLGFPSADEAPLVDVYFFWSDGEPMGNLELATESVGARALWPCRLVPDATTAVGAPPLETDSTRARTDPGWFSAIAQPPAPIEIGLALGFEVLARERVEPDSTSVRITLDRARVEGALCTLRGSVPGLEDAASFVAVWPPVGGGVLVSPRSATGEGDGFLVTELPPGPVTLVLRGSPAKLNAGLFELAREHGLTALAQGKRVRSQEQWDLRLDYLRTRREPIARWRLDLSAGEDRDLGALEFQRAGAVVLQLVDRAGAPVDATGVRIAPLGSADSGSSERTTPTVWTYDCQVAVTPLGPRGATLHVTQGDRAALVSVMPDAALAPHIVTLEDVSVLQLPDGEDVRVTTAEGHALFTDPRWIGSAYRGVQVGAGTWLLPPGAYVVEGLGAARPIALPAEHRIDLRESSRFDGPLDNSLEGPEDVR